MNYPFCIVFLLIQEFTERFCYYGVISLLSLYLHARLGYEEDRSTVIFHVFNALSYFTTVFGAIVADSWLGKYRTITLLILVYATGVVLLTFGSLPFMHSLARTLTLVSLLIVSIGTGGIKPCVAAFGGDQFKLPEQEKQLSKYFSIFYFSINAGSLTTMALSPTLRALPCFGELSCYPVAFGLNAVLITVSTACFLLGKHWYIIKPPTGNMCLMVSKCIGHAIKKKIELKGTEPRQHWLDYAEDKYGAQLVADTKNVFSILILFLPLPVFWALYDQQGSRWLFQASRMNGELGSLTMLPEHVMVLNPVLVLLFIPLCQFVIYPILSKFNLATDIRKLVIGGFLAALAFVISGFLEIELQKTYPVLPYKGNAQLRIFNGYSKELTLKLDNSDTKITIEALGIYVDKEIQLEGSKIMTLEILEGEEPKSEEIEIQEASAVSVFLHAGGFQSYQDEVDKSSNGLPAVRILFAASSEGNATSSVHIKQHSSGEIVKSATAGAIALNTIPASTYDVLVDDKTFMSEYRMALGGVYTIMVVPETTETYKVSVQVIAEPNSMHMLWMLPQVIVVTFGEVFFSITGLEFSFSQSPESMKSVVQACWLLTITFGNVIVIIVAESKMIEEQYIEFFLFAILMAIDMGIFMILAKRYKPRKVETAETPT